MNTKFSGTLAFGVLLLGVWTTMTGGKAAPAILLKTDQITRLLAKLDRLIAAHPNNSNLYAERGGLRALIGQTKDAVSDLQRAIALDPKATGSYLQLGGAQMDLKDYRGAVVTFGRALMIDPKNADFYERRAAAENETGDFDDAIADATKAIELAPKDAASAYTDRAGAKKAKGDMKGFKADLDTACSRPVL